MTFKKKIESKLEAHMMYLCPTWGKKCDECTLCKELVTDLLAAYREAVEGMPQIPRKYIRPDGCWGYDFSEEREAGAEKQLEACKEHLLKQLREGWE